MSSSYNNSISLSFIEAFLLSDDGTEVNNFNHEEPMLTMNQEPNSDAPPSKKQRNQSGNRDPNAEVIALSPEIIMAKNRFICEVCNKGFQRQQNLQLHRRVHNLIWDLEPNSNKEVKRKVYVCPEPTCVHHDPSRALGDLSGIKKHYYRKHCEKKWTCEKCSRRYAVQSDLKAHSKTCGTKIYTCECGTTFYRRDRYITHKQMCHEIFQEYGITPTVSNPAMASVSALSHNHLGDNPNSSFTPLAPCYNPNLFNFGYFQDNVPHDTRFPSLFTNGGDNNDLSFALPRGLNSSSSSNVVANNFDDIQNGNFQDLMNSLGATTDHQGRSSSTFDLHFRNNLSMGASDSLNLDLLGDNGGILRNFNGGGRRNVAP